MIRFLRGKFYPQIDGTCVIETASGIGFSVTLPANSPLYTNFDGDEVKVYTYMIVREDDMSLYGFDSPDEMELFTQLISVSGVGPKAGMAIMSILPLNELKRAIARGDVKMISQANGVGKKTAERVILELKDKVSEFTEDLEEEGEAAVPQATSERNEAVAGLLSLGYSRSEAEDALAHIKENDLSTEEYIKRALKSMF